MVFQSRPVSAPSTPWYALWRSPLGKLSLRRLLRGGRLNDAGRLPRYAGILMLGASAIWAPILGYLGSAPVRYASDMSLILPGAGVSASVNLNEIGQASSYATSAFSSNSISPTETYKRLIAADRILSAAAASMQMQTRDFGAPRITLVDQTGLIHLQMTGNSPQDAQKRGQAVLHAFFTELDRLRTDEQQTREGGGMGAIREYHASVQATRDAIANLQRESGLYTAEQYKEQVAATDRLRADTDTLQAELDKRTGAVTKLSEKLRLGPDQAAAALKLFADAEYLALVQQMSDSAAELAGLSARFGTRHPEVSRAAAAYQTEQAKSLARAVALTGLPVEVLERIDLAPDGARAELLAELVRQETERAGLAAQVAGMTARLSHEDSRVKHLAPLAARLEDLQRDFAVAEAVFASAIARSQSTKSDIYASYPLVQVLEDPTMPEHPSSPNRKLALLAGIAATFFLLIGLALGWGRGAIIGMILAPRPTPEAPK